MSLDKYLLFLIIVSLFPTYTNPIRCYKCAKTDVCKTITNYSLFNEKYDVIDCEYYCWKSISLGN